MEIQFNTAGIIVIIAYLTMCIGFLLSKVNGWILVGVTILILLIIGFQEKDEEKEV